MAVNKAFTVVPFFYVMGCEVSPMDILAGIIYLVRDFAQRDLGHRVLYAMLIGMVLSYLTSAPEVVLASISAFATGELIDWAIFTFTKKPLSQRLLWSATISAPVDSLVFLAVLGHLNIISFTLMTLGKCFGVFIIWYGWRKRTQQTNSIPA